MYPLPHNLVQNPPENIPAYTRTHAKSVAAVRRKYMIQDRANYHEGLARADYELARGLRRYRLVLSTKEMRELSGTATNNERWAELRRAWQSMDVEQSQDHFIATTKHGRIAAGVRWLGQWLDNDEPGDLREVIAGALDYGVPVGYIKDILGITSSKTWKELTK